jgi:hypothetical protein
MLSTRRKCIGIIDDHYTPPPLERTVVRAVDSVANLFNFDRTSLIWFDNEHIWVHATSNTLASITLTAAIVLKRWRAFARPL